MKIEFFYYWPAKKRTVMTDIKKELPPHILSELVTSPVADSAIMVETSKREVVRFLDELLGIGTKFLGLVTKTNYTKYLHVEIDASELDSYEFFFISPVTLELRKDVTFAFRSPSCASGYCQTGAAIIAPIRIKGKHANRLNLGELCWEWDQAITLIISRRLKDLFDERGLTGLKYSACFVDSDQESADATSINGKPPFFQATFDAATCQHASAINVRTWCKKHMVITDYDLFELETRRQDLLSADFQMIDRVIVGKAAFLFRRPLWVVSRRVLRLLLEERVTGLRTKGPLLKQRFLPLVTSGT